MRGASYHPTPRDRDVTAWCLLGLGLAACASVFVLAIPLFYRSIADFEYLSAATLIGLFSGAMAPLLLGTAWRGSRRAVALLGLVLCLFPIPLAGQIFDALGRKFVL